MRKIRSTMPLLHVLLLSALLLAGCAREKFSGVGSVAEEEPARIEFNPVVLTMNSGSPTRALTPEQENKIENLRVMMLRANGPVVSNGKYVNSGSKFTIDSYSDSNYTFSFIVNISNAGIEAKLQPATSLPEVGEVVTTATQLDFGMNATHSLIMTGRQENVTFAPSNNTYGTPIQPHSIIAKMTLIVINKTPTDQGVSIIGWDVENVPVHSYLFPYTADVNVNLPGTSTDKDDYWLTTDVDYPFEAEDKPNKTVSQTLYVFENRRGGRVNKSLPTNSADRYPGTSFSDKGDRGKGWPEPARAATIAIKAMHKITLETKQVKVHIYSGADNHSDYNIERSKHYIFTATVNGLSDIKVGLNVDYVLGEPLVDHGDNPMMDTYPDFRPMRIYAPRGKVIMEILDNSGRAYNDPDSDVIWLRTSPLGLTWYQVKQSPPNGEWQQQAEPESRMVRPKYIPHRSIRVKLQAQGIAGWDAISGGQEDDDVMTFANATYRMCYKITDTPSTEVTVTNKTLHVYADGFLMRDGKHGVQVRPMFYKEGEDPARPEVRMFNINQEGYISSFLGGNDPDTGLWILSGDGIPSNVRNKFVREREREYSLTLYPGALVSFQRLQGLTWGFRSRIAYDKDDRWGNGKFSTANIVYNDVKRVNNEVVNLGRAFISYRPMYSGEMGNFVADVSIPPYSGGAAPPYYHPAMSSFRNELYHPVYRSSLERYCHEKNRNISGDGITGPVETYWYLSSKDELVLLYTGTGTFENPNRYVYASVIEDKEWTIGNGIAVNLLYHHLLGSPDTGAVNKITAASRAFCIRSLQY